MTECGLPATWVVHWPGRSVFMCDRHAGWAREVAKAMGFELMIVAISTTSTPTCTSAVAAA